MRCEPILREGMGYHQVTPEKENDWKYMSATAIRAQLENGFEQVKGMPEEALKAWKEAGYSMKTEDFWPVLALALRLRKEKLVSYKDVSEDLAAVFSREILQAADYESFIHACKTKNITMARVKRAMLQILFEVKKRRGRRGCHICGCLGGGRMPARFYLKFRNAGCWTAGKRGRAVERERQGKVGTGYLCGRHLSYDSCPENRDATEK